MVYVINQICMRLHVFLLELWINNTEYIFKLWCLWMPPTKSICYFIYSRVFHGNDCICWLSLNYVWFLVKFDTMFIVFLPLSVSRFALPHCFDQMIILVLCDTRDGVYFFTSRYVFISRYGVKKGRPRVLFFISKFEISNSSLWMVSICNKPVGCGVAIPNASREGALRKAWTERACLNHFSSLFSTCIVYCNQRLIMTLLKNYCLLFQCFVFDYNVYICKLASSLLIYILSLFCKSASNKMSKRRFYIYRKYVKCK